MPCVNSQHEPRPSQRTADRPVPEPLHGENALTAARDKAETETAGQRAKVEVQANRRITLMELRASFTRLAVARRHARGEVYSKARVAAINAMGPTRASMDASVKSHYLRQPDSQGVLKMHALSHFTTPLASLRLGLALLPADLVQEARAMQAQEEAFATAWIAALDDPDFALDIRQRRREVMVKLRTAPRPMVLVTCPALGCLTDEDCAGLGKMWNRLDTLADPLGAKSLSQFIALGDEGESAGVPAHDMLPTVESLLAAVQNPANAFPSRKKAVSILGNIRIHC